MESKTTFSKYGLKHHLWFLVVTFFLFQVRRTSIMTPPAEKEIEVICSDENVW